MLENYRETAENLEKLKRELSSAEAELAEYAAERTEERANGRVAALKNAVRNFLQQIGGILLKIAKLSGGRFGVSGGRIVYSGAAAAEPCTAETAESIVEREKQAITACLRHMAGSGVTPSAAAALGKSLNTLYAVYDGADNFADVYRREEQQKSANARAAAEEKRNTLLRKLRAAEEMFARAKDSVQAERARFQFSEIVVEDDYGKAIQLPVGAEQRGDLLLPRYWAPLQDGVLLFDYESGEIDDTVGFVEALTMQFLYAYPAADKQILYCCGKSNDALNNFWASAESNLVAGMFFGRGRMRRLDAFEYQVPELIEDLRDTVKKRSSLLDGTDMKHIFAYNAANEKDVQKPILAILHDYPNGYQNCKDMEYLFRNGAKAGVFFLVLRGGKAAGAEDGLLQYSHVKCALSGDRFTVNGELSMMPSIARQRARQLLEQLGGDVKKLEKKLTYDDIGFGREAVKAEDVKDSISIPVGMVDNLPYSMEFAVAGDDEEKPISYLAIGGTGSGKSSLIDSIIFNGAMKYSPDDLQFYLIDFKDGVSSAKFAADRESPIPHVRLISGESKQEEAEIILNTLLAEKERRNKIITANMCSNLAQYNARAEKHMPRIIVVIDEVRKLFEEESGDRGRSDRLATACKTIVHEGRSSGIHLFFASQSADRHMMNLVAKFMRGRFCFSATEEDAEVVLNPADAKRVLLECDRPGVALVSHNGGVTCRKVKIAHHFERHGEYAARIREKWANFPVETVTVGDSSPLPAAEAAKSHTLFDDAALNIPVGENFYDHTVVRLPFDDTHRSLLLLGEDKRIQAEILTSAMIGILRAGAKVKLIDGSREAYLESIFGGHPDVQVYSPKEYLDLLADVNAEYETRALELRRRFEPYFVVFYCLPMIVDFVKNTERKKRAKNADTPRDDDLPDWYQSDWREGFASDGEEEEKTVYGAETFYELLGSLNRVDNMYFCFSMDKASSVKYSKSTVEECDYKIFHAAFVETMYQLAGGVYKNSIAASCNENMALLSVKQQPFIKMRYFRYGADAESQNYIHSLGGKRDETE